MSTHKMSKTTRRITFLRENADRIAVIREEARRTRKHESKRARLTPGFGWWVRAANLAGIPLDSEPYWSGGNPTPSIAIPDELAAFLRACAPDGLL